MKKDVSPENTESKSVFYQAGEIIGSIGFHIVDGKDKVIGAIKNKLGKKQAPESNPKKVSKKKLPVKAGKKMTGAVKKSAKKTSPAKGLKKKTDKVKKVSNTASEKKQ